MKKADKLYNLIKSGLERHELEKSVVSTITLEEKIKKYQEDYIIVEKNRIQYENDKLNSVEELSERFAVRDRNIIEKNRKNQIENELTGVESIISEPVVESSDDMIKLVSVFGAAEKEPKLTNWNGEFKGYFIYIF